MGIKTVTINLTKRNIKKYQEYLENYDNICNNLTELNSMYEKKLGRIIELSVENNELKRHLKNIEDNTMPKNLTTQEV